MAGVFDDSALLRWDGIHLVADLAALEFKVEEAVRSIEAVSDIRIDGYADVLALDATVHFKGLSSRVRIELKEIRLRARRLGFRLGKLKVLRGLRVPRSLVELILERVGRERIRVFKSQDIAVVDLRDYIPPEVDLRLLTLQVSGRHLHLWLGPGALIDLPSRKVPVRNLPFGTQELLESGPKGNSREEYP